MKRQPDLLDKTGPNTDMPSCPLSRNLDQSRRDSPATDRVRRDIIEQLALREPRTFITGFARPNLFYEVQCPRSERQKPESLVRFLGQNPAPGTPFEPGGTLVLELE